MAAGVLQGPGVEAVETVTISCTYEACPFEGAIDLDEPTSADLHTPRASPSPDVG